MKLAAIALFAACIGAAGATADPTDCPLDGYDSAELQPEVVIPDIGFLDSIGPIRFPDDGRTIADVVMELDIEHTWVGNLVVTITYDVDCDGSNVVGPVRLLCRQLLDGCPEEHVCCGCGADLIAGTPYLFSDDGGKEMANTFEQCQSGVVPGGCYRPASESEHTLGVFDDLPRDGCWYMRIYDGAGGDYGILHRWTVHLDGNASTPAQPTTWGTVKAEYRD